MTRGWIALVMIALSLLLGITEYSYVTSNSNVYLRMLEEADQRMEEHDFIGAESTAKRLNNRFRNQSGIFNIFMYHSEVGDIESDLMMMIRYAQTGNSTDFLATSACARREIQSIRQSKQLRWDNLF